MNSTESITDGEIRAGESQAVAPISAGYCQYPGTWAGEVEAQICLLDPSAASGREGGSKGSMGFEHGRSGSRGLGQAEGGGAGDLSQAPSSHLFFSDVFATAVPYGWEPSGIYIRHSREILGYEETDDVPSNSNTHRCFNCGSPDHSVSSCPEPKDRGLISLSRQLFELLQEPTGPTDFRRLHQTEAWRQQRLDWLGLFKPGELRGQLLREAVGPREGDWLENIAIWGYPRGWVGVTDPQALVRQRIMDEYAGSHDEQDLSVVLGEGILGDRSQYLSFDDSDSVQLPDSGHASASSDTITSLPSERRRWAEYPNTHFSSELLPVYTGIAFPPVEFEGSSTYTDERRALWERLINPPAPSYSLPPPPPPTSSPPPPPPSSPPPLPPARTPPPLNLPHLHLPSSNAHDEYDEVDMDLSD
ncbi:uncharacterized protein ARMOST_15653 [Armillaria ostoyae]|uniref:CCHC-type domain-containing protein n=1 Tax=Armillaria ostoyae TaxID=47428 RepID=A0A284RTY1_ARMOS|nr:uncharacterized protein ARMOST_15653 [Armillaria ostoyae]